MQTIDDTKFSIAMSEHPTVRIDPVAWPEIVAVERVVHGHLRALRVRQHAATGRRIVHGSGSATTAGFLVENTGNREAETVRALRRVAGIIAAQELVDECIRALPPEEL